MFYICSYCDINQILYCLSTRGTTYCVKLARNLKMDRR